MLNPFPGARISLEKPKLGACYREQGIQDSKAEISFYSQSIPNVLTMVFWNELSESMWWTAKSRNHCWTQVLAQRSHFRQSLPSRHVLCINVQPCGWRVRRDSHSLACLRGWEASDYRGEGHRASAGIPDSLYFHSPELANKYCRLGRCPLSRPCLWRAASFHYCIWCWDTVGNTEKVQSNFPKTNWFYNLC